MKTKLSIAIRPILCALAAVSFASSANARTWTNNQGQKIEADLVEIKGEVAVLKLPTGRTYDIPLATLSEADQSFAKEQAAKPVTEVPKTAAAPSIFKELLDGKLVAVKGRRVSKYEIETEPEYYAFYFSASWCPPCKVFTPNLISFYKENPGAKKTFEVILVSRDNSEAAMEAYMTDDAMPWPAIRFRDIDRLKEVTRYAGSGIPCLVLVDRQGKVISDSYVDKQYRGPTPVMNEMGKLAAKKVATK
jgi:nucleoredoxin